jgi:hypothetical protein
MALPDIKFTVLDLFLNDSETPQKLATYAGCVAGARLTQIMAQKRFSDNYNYIASKTWMGPLRMGGMSSAKFILALYTASEGLLMIEDLAFHAPELMFDRHASSAYSHGMETVMNAMSFVGHRRFFQFSTREEAWTQYQIWVDEAVTTVNTICLPQIAALKTRLQQEAARPANIQVGILDDRGQQLYIETRPMPPHNALRCAKCGVCAHCAWEHKDCDHRFTELMKVRVQVRADHVIHALVYEFFLPHSSINDFRVDYFDNDAVAIKYGNGEIIPEGLLRQYLLRLVNRYDTEGSKKASEPTMDQTLTEIARAVGVMQPRWAFEVYRIVTKQVTLGDFVQAMPSRHLAECLSVLAKVGNILARYDVTSK